MLFTIASKIMAYSGNLTKVGQEFYIENYKNTGENLRKI